MVSKDENYSIKNSFTKSISYLLVKKEFSSLLKSDIWIADV